MLDIYRKRLGEMGLGGVDWLQPERLEHMRGYVDEPTCWRYSSARNYADREGLIEVFVDWIG